MGRGYTEDVSTSAKFFHTKLLRSHVSQDLERMEML